MPVSHYLVRRVPVRRRHTSQLYANNSVAGLSHPRFGRVKYVIGPKARPKKAGCSSSGHKLSKCPGKKKPCTKCKRKKRKAPAKRRRY